MNQKRPKVGVGVMVKRGDKVLLGKRKGAHGESTYGWIGGHLEFGETPKDCARREAMEETGLKIINLKLICVSNIIAYDKHYLDLEFSAETVGEPKVLEPDKVEAWEWHDINNLPKPLFKAVELAIESYKTGKIYNT